MDVALQYIRRVVRKELLLFVNLPRNKIYSH